MAALLAHLSDLLDAREMPRRWQWRYWTMVSAMVPVVFAMSAAAVSP
jgi:hypothetical protein